jgi:hyperosmotically inducible periplasmic protein
LKVRLALLLAAAALAPATGALADTQALAAVVTAAVRECRHLTIFDTVAARVEEGAVVLSGKVTAAAKRDEVIRRVAALDGVREVRNEITVLPASAADDALRYRVSRAIYGHPSFWPHAAMAHPPIHILVENGHVTLTGMVATRVERAMARSLASGRGEVSLADELQTAR